MFVDSNAKSIKDASPVTQPEVERVDSWAGLLRLQKDWDKLYSLDPSRDYFLSFRWLKECFLEHRGSWMVLIARLEDQIVGIFPLSARSRFSQSKQQDITIWQTGGRLQSAQYAGYLCDPAHWQDIARAFSSYLNNQTFDRLRLENFLDTERLEALLQGFDETRHRYRVLENLSNGGKTDNLVCPKITLVNPLEKWVEGFSSNRRQKLRRALRKISPEGSFHIVSSDPDTALAHLEVLLELWKIQWKGKRSSASIDMWYDRYWQILKNPARRGELSVPILYQDDTPVCSIANILDHEAGHSYCIVTGRNIEDDSQDIGTMIHMHSLTDVIERGFSTYDFCHGNEPYKYHFGSEDRRLASVEISRRSQKKAS